MIETWIDALAKIWELDNGKGGTVRSYRVYEKNEFPDSLSVFPCAISYPQDVVMKFSAGGPATDVWRGVTEFHILKNVQKSLLPEVMRYFARIRNAAAANITLGGRVSHFYLRTDGQSIIGPSVLQYGSEEPHIGVQVFWNVKENVSGEVTVSVGS